MCWSVPGKVVELKEDNKCIVDVSGVKKEVALDLLEDVKVGEYLLIHAGYALQKVDEEKAKFTMEFFQNKGKN
ncbi:MAG: HypC/HybG/HupF family hydrogenase formation chaperone [Candidatus Omnitrophica bacterium]|nr:HypC/HybG/HupF family hydrogenase formation chaperone [Candidatus Omnitrophota bacterium]